MNHYLLVNETGKHAVFKHQHKFSFREYKILLLRFRNWLVSQMREIREWKKGTYLCWEDSRIVFYSNNAKNFCSSLEQKICRAKNNISNFLTQIWQQSMGYYITTWYACAKTLICCWKPMTQICQSSKSTTEFLEKNVWGKVCDAPKFSANCASVAVWCKLFHCQSHLIIIA